MVCTNWNSAVMGPWNGFSHSSWRAENTNAGASSIPDALYLCDKRAVPKPPIDICRDDCCLGGFGGLWGSHTGNAIDTTMSTNVYGKQDWGDIFEGGLKGWMTNLFVGSWAGAQQTGYYAVPNLVSGAFGALGNMAKNGASIFFG